MVKMNGVDKGNDGSIMDFLIRMPQWHEDFRQQELDALADLYAIRLEWVKYDSQHQFPFAHIRLPNISSARLLISRAVLSDSIYHLWGIGTTYHSLHESVHEISSIWQSFKKSSFRFKVHSFNHRRPHVEQVGIIEGFTYLGLEGVVDMKNPEEEFAVLEEFISPHPPKDGESKEPVRIYFGRLIGNSGRFDAIGKYDLKKRRYIDTTSMDAELALVTANMAHARPGKIFWDPFAGTGGFLVTAAHFGAMVLGSDIDGRALRGKDPKARANFIEPKRGPKRKIEEKRQWNVISNFEQYGLMDKWLDGFSADMTNTPVRCGSTKRWVDGIMCDPPYGIREGLRVLGWRKAEDHAQSELCLMDGKPAYLDPSYVPPKRPYSFDALLADILDLAAEMLVDNGRLAMWMPAANTVANGQPAEDEVDEIEGIDLSEVVEYTIPQNRYLRLSSASVQPFNKWSRRLLTYIRIPESQTGAYIPRAKPIKVKGDADDLNYFRKQYFEGFKSPSPSSGV